MNAQKSASWRGRAARWAAVAAVLATFLSVVWMFLCCCPLRFGGDASAYFSQAARIRGGYVQRNWQAAMAARRGEQGEAIRREKLSTEAGYGFLLAATHRLGLRVPFILNGVVVPLVLLALMALVYAMDKDRRRGALTAVLLLFLLIVTLPVLRTMRSMTRPSRDPASHLLGLLGLLAAWSATRSARHGGKLAALSGFSIGFSAWFRITGILYAAPAGLMLVIEAGLPNWRKWLRPGILMGLGLFLGLTPLFLQNALEGRTFYASSQMKGVTGMTARHIAEKERGDWHPANLKLLLWRSTRNLFDDFRPVARAAVFAGIALLAWRSFRRYIPLLAGVLIFLLFYSCYEGVTDRYLLPTSLFLAALGAVALGHIIAAALRRIHSGRWRELSLPVVLVLVSFFTTATAMYYTPSPDFFGPPWREAMRFREWAATTFDPNDALMTSRQNVRSWLRHFGPGWTQVTWDWLHRGEAEKRDTLKRVIDEGRKVYFLASRDDAGAEAPSWWKDSLMNDYDVLPTQRVFVADNGVAVVPYLVSPRSVRQMDLRPDGTASDARHLFLFARKLSGPERRQAVTLSSRAWPSPIQAQIQAGPNLIGVPSAVTELEVKSDAPLPTMLTAQWLGAQPLRLDLRGFSAAPSVHQMFSNVDLSWSGEDNWKSDVYRPHGGRPNYPVFFLTPKTEIRLPPSADDLVVRLWMTATDEFDERKVSAARLAGKTAGIRYRRGGHRFTPETIIVGDARRTPGGDWIILDFMQSFRVPGAAHSSGDEADLRVIAEGLDKSHRLRLHRVEISLARNEAPITPTSEANPPARAWRNPADAGWRGSFEPRPWPEGARWALRSRMELSLGDLGCGRGDALLLSCYWPKEQDRTAFRLLAAVNGKAAGEYTIEPGGRPAPVFVPLRKAKAPLRLTLTPIFEGAPGVPPVLTFVRVVRADDPTPPAISMDPADDLSFLVADMWDTEEGKRHRHFRWTREDSSVLFPLAGKPRRLTLGLQVRGAFPQVGPVLVRVEINGHYAGEEHAQPEQPQTLLYRVEPDMLVEGMNEIGIASRTWRPVDVLGVPDRRALGVCLEAVDWKP